MIKINPNIFKANDIRGEYPSEINEKIISEIAQYVGQYFIQLTGRRKAKIVLAHDARLSSPSLYKAVIKGIMNNELRIKNGKIIIHNSKFIIHKIGLATTPMFYFLVKKLKANAGIMITASHLPKNYNGLKIVDENALPISGLKIGKLFML